MEYTKFTAKLGYPFQITSDLQRSVNCYRRLKWSNLMPVWTVYWICAIYISLSLSPLTQLHSAGCCITYMSSPVKFNLYGSKQITQTTIFLWGLYNLYITTPTYPLRFLKQVRNNSKKKGLDREKIRNPRKNHREGIPHFSTGRHAIDITTPEHHMPGALKKGFFRGMWPDGHSFLLFSVL